MLKYEKRTTPEYVEADDMVYGPSTVGSDFA